MSKPKKQRKQRQESAREIIAFKLSEEYMDAYSNMDDDQLDEFSKKYPGPSCCILTNMFLTFANLCNPSNPSLSL